MALLEDGALSFSEEGAMEMAGADDLPVTPSRMRRLALVRSSSFILVVVVVVMQPDMSMCQRV